MRAAASVPDNHNAGSVEEWRWHESARCAGEALETFYAPESLKGRRLEQSVERAKSICKSCPVLIQCRDYALRSAEPFGVWGATTPRERKIWSTRQGWTRR
jgi:WhiB family redox-sensing transcriptional regulator